MRPRSAWCVCLALLSAGGRAEAAEAEPDFTLELRVDVAKVTGDERLYDGGSFFVGLRLAGRDEKLGLYDRYLGNYLNFALPDGSCPVLEAVIPDAPFARIKSYEDLPSGCRVGIPLGALSTTNDIHDVRVTWRKTSWRISVDGEEEDVDFLVKPLKASSDSRVTSARVRAFSRGPAVPPEEPDAKPIPRSIQYWTGPGFNTWVGDVTVFTWHDRLHLFYLQDRRHHRSKGSSGGHYFAHISTGDLVRWDEHPVVTPIEKYWFTCGTGTPFAYDGKLCLAFGVHSTRYVLREETTEPWMLEELKRRGGVMPSRRFAGTDLIPLGATWASSSDGVRFEPSGIVFHTTQNPAIENMADGSLRLTTGFFGDTGVKGTWRSRTMADWRKTDERSPLKGDCPCPFEWNGWRYLLQGFVGYAIAEPGGELKEVDGRDLYDGLSVPMAASWQGNRRILAGWMSYPFGRGWGGWLVLRELVQRKDGSLGTRFVPEIVPPSPIHRISVRGGAAVALTFAPESGSGRPVRFATDPKTGRAFARDVLPDGSLAPLGIHHTEQSIEVTNVRGLDQDHEVRFVVHRDDKADATILDFEIAGNRTLVVRRPGAYATMPVESAR